MPFSCFFQLNNGAINPSDRIVFVEYINSVFDSYHKERVKIAHVLFNGEKAYINSNCPCYVSSTGDLKQGQEITKSTIIGYFSADGEDIPYNKPYAIIVKD